MCPPRPSLPPLPLFFPCYFHFFCSRELLSSIPSPSFASPPPPPPRHARNLVHLAYIRQNETKRRRSSREKKNRERTFVAARILSFPPHAARAVRPLLSMYHYVGMLSFFSLVNVRPTLAEPGELCFICIVNKPSILSALSPVIHQLPSVLLA